jgi:hypothetical protein
MWKTHGFPQETDLHGGAGFHIEFGNSLPGNSWLKPFIVLPSGYLT